MISAQPKPEPRKRTKARRQRAARKVTRSVRAQLFEFYQNRCACCRFRQAESLHEVVPRSLGGKVSLLNSVPVCGSGTTKCHGYLQRHEIRAAMGYDGSVWTFFPGTTKASRWMDPS